MNDIKSTKTNKPSKVKKSRNIGLIIKVSLFWITLAILVVAFIQYGQMQFQRGMLEGMNNTKSILQIK